MTLRCECGGAVTIVRGTYPDVSGDVGDGFTETYECASCGRTGTLAVDGTTRQTRLSGCLVESGGGYL